VLIAPLMPGINDSPAQVEELLDRATEAGATSIGGIGLHLRGEVRHVFMQWLREQRPDLVPRYEKLYSRGAYAPREERERLARMIRRAGTPSGFRPVSRQVAPSADTPTPEPRPIQDTLF
jgi:DNA repair photolyase